MEQVPHGTEIVVLDWKVLTRRIKRPKIRYKTEFMRLRLGYAEGTHTVVDSLATWPDSPSLQ